MPLHTFGNIFLQQRVIKLFFFCRQAVSTPSTRSAKTVMLGGSLCTAAKVDIFPSQMFPASIDLDSDVGSQLCRCSHTPLPHSGDVVIRVRDHPTTSCSDASRPQMWTRIPCASSSGALSTASLLAGIIAVFSADVAGLRRFPLCIVSPGKWPAESFAQDVGVFRAPCCDPAAQALVGLARVAF
jgi:hypothetical protein